MDKKKFVQDLVSKMTLEQKVGQCFVIGYVGSLITPEIINRVKKYYPAGIRAGLMWRIRTVKHDPNGTNTDYAHRLLRPFSGTMKDFLPDIPVPVSYTHLDVYKRQFLYRKLRSLCNKTLRGIALPRKELRRYSDTPQAENPASGILFHT